MGSIADLCGECGRLECVCGRRRTARDAANKAASKAIDAIAERHLGGPDDDHYARLGPYQPLLVTQAWARSWPPVIAYNLGEAIAAISRVGTKGTPVRDLRKAAWLLTQAADVLEAECGASK